MKPKLSIVKIGGNVIEDKIALANFLNAFSKINGAKLLVHGGGKKATLLSRQMGVEPKLIDGRRITNAATLEIITMVYAGLTNKNIVAQLQANACNAIGLSGADGNTILAHKRPITTIDHGYVGDIDQINHKAISRLLNAAFVPVFCAMSHDGKGQLLNTNADTIAASLAIGMSNEFETTLYYCFEKNGVLTDVSDENSILTHINSETYQDLIQKHLISDGMLPKLKNCFHALENGVSSVCVGSISMLNNPTDPCTKISL